MTLAPCSAEDVLGKAIKDQTLWDSLRGAKNDLAKLRQVVEKDAGCAISDSELKRLQKALISDTVRLEELVKHLLAQPEPWSRAVFAPEDDPEE